MRSFDSILADMPSGHAEPAGPMLSRQLAAIPPTMTGEFDALVNQLRSQGRYVIGLHTSDPGVNTPDHIVEAAAAACRSERLQHRTPLDGLPELRDAIATRASRDSGLDVRSGSVVVTCGTKQAISSALAAVLDPGDEVLVPAPYWPTYPISVHLAGGSAVIVPTSMANGFKVTVEQLESGLSHLTKVLILCSPCNPTGAVYTPDELAEIGAWAADEGLWVITDETYGRLIYGDAVARSLPAAAPAIRDRCIVINSVSKAFGMTGWPVAWLIGPSSVVGAVSTFQFHATSRASSVAQAAAVAALEGDQTVVHALRSDLDRRRRRLSASLEDLPGVQVIEPHGALYVFPSVEACLGGSLGSRAIRTTLELSWALLEQVGIAVLPGEAFGRIGHLRISFSLADEVIEDGIARLRTSLGELIEKRL